MTSKTNVYTWIADYACKHRLEEIITEVFKDINGTISIQDISQINLKNALVWMTVKNDIRDEFQDAIRIVDSLLNEAIKCSCLAVFIRLSLGLRMKDLSQSLTLPADTFEERVEKYFPASKFQMEKKNLSQVFSESDIDDFENLIADVCKYFRTIIKNEEDKANLLTNYPQSHFGVKLSEGLKSLTQEFFDKLAYNQPLNKLEQMVKCGARNFDQADSSPWHAWLVDRLSGIRELDNDIVRNLMSSLQWHEAVSPANQPHQTTTDRKAGGKKKKRSEANMVEPVSVGYEEEVIMVSSGEESNDVYVLDDSCPSDLGSQICIVPSSRGTQDVWIQETPSDKTFPGNYSVPNLRQFLK